MSKDSVVIPPNVNRYNEYKEWDRGLFFTGLDGDKKIARVMEALWTTKGDMMSPGILKYKLEYYSNLGDNIEELNTFKTKRDNQWSECITRGVCDNPIIIEAYAIQHFIRNINEATEERKQHVNRVASNITKSLSKGVIEEMTATIQFANTPVKPLEVSHAIVEYIAKLPRDDGSILTLQNTLMPDINNLRPFYLVLADIDDKVSNM